MPLAASVKTCDSCDKFIELRILEVEIKYLAGVTFSY